MATLPGLTAFSKPRIVFKGPRPAVGRRTTIIVRSEAVERASRGALAQKLGSALLSAAVVLSIGEAVVAPPASADSGLEKRQAELQRRKELLAKAREKALAAGGQEDGAEAAPAAAVPEEEQAQQSSADEDTGREFARMKESLMSSLQSYETTTKEQKKPKPAETAPQNPAWFTNLFENKSEQTEEPPKDAEPLKAQESPPQAEAKEEAKPAAPAFSFSAPKIEPPMPPPPPPAPKAEEPASKAEEPTPKAEEAAPSLQMQAQPTPTPATKPAEPAAEPRKQKVGPQPVQPVRKEQAQPVADSKRGKRKGPLPAAVVQLLLLAAFGGLGYIVFFKEQQLDRAVTSSVKAVITAYRSVTNLFNKQGKKA